SAIWAQVSPALLAVNSRPLSSPSTSARAAGRRASALRMSSGLRSAPRQRAKWARSIADGGMGAGRHGRGPSASAPSRIRCSRASFSRWAWEWSARALRAMSSLRCMGLSMQNQRNVVNKTLKGWIDARTPRRGRRRHLRGQGRRAGHAAPRGPAGSRRLRRPVRRVPRAPRRRRALAELGEPPVAVRSSASGEDGARASAAGQHESFLAVCGAGAVAEAVRACWASLYSPRAVGYRAASGGGDPVMAVIVQRQVDAEVSGVMVTGEPTRIEASYGLGPSVVEGKVTPDSYAVTADGPVSRTIADKRTRLDRRGTRLVTTDVPAHARNRPAIDDATARRLAAVGERIAAVLGGQQDIEWAITGDDLWILQSRPVTAALPPPLSRGNASTTPLTGTPAASLLTGRQDDVPGTSPAGTGESVTTGTPEGATGALNGTPGSR